MNEFWIWIYIAYLSGSLPFGLLLVKVAGKGDIRDIGSGNIGATNVLRTGSKKLAILTLLFDALKGFIPVIVASQLTEFSLKRLSWIGLAAIIGHIFPIWLKLKGGKGVATALGVFAALNPFLAGILLGFWMLCAVIFRISSFAALVAIVIAPIAAWGLGETSLFPMVIIVTMILAFSHRNNVNRLLKGEEKDFRKKP